MLVQWVVFSPSRFLAFTCLRSTLYLSGQPSWPDKLLARIPKMGVTAAPWLNWALLVGRRAGPCQCKFPTCGTDLCSLCTSGAIDGKSISVEWIRAELGGFSWRALGGKVWPEKSVFYVVHWKAALLLWLLFKVVWEHGTGDKVILLRVEPPIKWWY